jgi:hypothetical protein
LEAEVTVLDPRRPLRKTANDLAPGEAAVGGRLGSLARATPSEALRQKCLATVSLSRPPASDRYERPVFTAGWLRPLAFAASVLVAFGAVQLGGSQTAPERYSHPDERVVVGATLRVVDDPTVPLFHGVETFQELALWDRSMSSPAGGRGSR